MASPKLFNRFRTDALKRVLAAVALVAMNAPTLAMAASDLNDQLPGYGSGSKPRIMVIFDTSKSMQWLPETTIDGLGVLSGVTKYPDGGRGFKDHDYGQNLPDGGWTATYPDGGSLPCDNRFCVGKRTLSEVLPDYESKLQLGLAGYYQYITEEQPSQGTTTCYYDILEKSGVTRTYQHTVANATLSTGTNLVPPDLAANCNAVTGSQQGTYQLATGSPAYIGGQTVGCYMFGTTQGTNTAANGGLPANIPANASTHCNIASVTYVKSTNPTADTVIDYGANTGGTYANSQTDPGYYFKVATPTTACPSEVLLNAVNPSSWYERRTSNEAIATTIARPLNLNSIPYQAGTAVYGTNTCTSTIGCRMLNTGVTTSAIITPQDVDEYALGNSPNPYLISGCSLGQQCVRNLTGASTTINGQIAAPSNNTANCPLVVGAGPTTVTAANGWAAHGFTGNTPQIPCDKVSCLISRVADPAPTRPNVAVNPATASGMLAQIYRRPSTIGYPLTNQTLQCNTVSPNYIGTLTWKFPADNAPTATVGTYEISKAALGTTDCTSKTLYDGVTPALASWYAAPSGCSAGNGQCELTSPVAATITGATFGTKYYNPTTKADQALYPNQIGPIDEVAAKALTVGTSSCPSIPTDTGTNFAQCSGNGGCTAIVQPSAPTAASGSDTKQWLYDRGASYVSGAFTYTVNNALTTTVAQYAEDGSAGACPTKAQYSGTGQAPAGCIVGQPCDISLDTSKTMTAAGFNYPGLSWSVDGEAKYDFKCNYRVQRFTYTAGNLECKYTLKYYQYKANNVDSCRYTIKRWNVANQNCQGDPTYYCNYQATRYTYRYQQDGAKYCKYYRQGLLYSGDTPRYYNYTYQTKGGEMVNVKAVEAPANSRNYCFDQPGYNPKTAFSDGFGAADSNGNKFCRPVIDCNNQAQVPTDKTGAKICAVGQQALLRWRTSDGTKSVGGTANTNGRNMYFKGSNPTFANSTGCLAPDRSGGELTFNSSDYARVALGDHGTVAQVSSTTPLTSGNLTISCPVGQRISEIAYANWGTQTGTYPAATTSYNGTTIPMAFAVGACDARAASKAYVEALCLDKASCSVPASNAVNGGTDPCSGTTKSLAVHAICATNFCSAIGADPGKVVKLVSDWWDPGASNSKPTNVVNWTNQTSKESGWSRKDNGDSALTFVGIPQTGYVASTQVNSIKDALKTCKPPTDVNSSMKSLCRVDQAAPNTGGYDDVTPLKGSLENAKDYIKELLEGNSGTGMPADPEAACREYGILLLTDGLESTPKNYDQASLQATAASIKNLSYGSAGKTKNVRTFVVGFGGGLTGTGAATDLDILARAAGTAKSFWPDGGVKDGYDNNYGYALSAANGPQLKATLTSILSTFGAGTFTRSRPAIAVSSTVGENSRIYASYLTKELSGESHGNVMAYESLSTGTVGKWSFEDKFDSSSQSSRDLYSHEAKLTGAFNVPTFDDSKRVDFKTSNTDLVSTLAKMSSVSDTTDAQSLINFLKDRRNFSTALGQTFSARSFDFVHSNPAVVTPPSRANGWGGSKTKTDAYKNFRIGNQSRETRVLVGGNDGFLHSLREKTGQAACTTSESDTNCGNGLEDWAFVPFQTFQQLGSIRSYVRGTSSTYAWGVDGQIAVEDVCWTGNRSTTNCDTNDFLTIAIFGNREGGRGYTALDVTTPNDPKPLWSFTKYPLGFGFYGDIGFSYGGPSIGLVKYESGKEAFMTWVSGGTGGITGSGALFALSVKDGTYTNWSGGDTGWTGIGTLGNNLAARPALAIPNNSMYVDSVFLGGTDGKLYASRTRSTGNLNVDWAPKVLWDPTLSSQANDVTGSVTQVFKIGKPDDSTVANRYQKILTGETLPLSSPGPIYTRAKIRPRTGGGYDLFVGTGNVDEPGNATNQDYFYGIRDVDQANGNNATGKGTPIFVQKFDVGEKVVSEPTIIGETVYIPTYMPPVSVNSCAANGDSYIYAVDARTGEPANALPDPANPGQYVPVVKLDNVGIVSDLQVLDNRLVFGKGDGSVATLSVKLASITGKVTSWKRVK